MKYTEHDRDVTVALAICCLTRPFTAGGLMTLGRMTDYESIPYYLGDAIGTLGPLAMQFSDSPKLSYDRTRKLIPGRLTIVDYDGVPQEMDLLDHAIECADGTGDVDFYHLDEAIDAIAAGLVQHLSLNMARNEIGDAIRKSNSKTLGKLGQAIIAKTKSETYVDDMTDLFDAVADKYGDIIFNSEERTVAAPDSANKDYEKIEAVFSMNVVLFSLDKLAHAFNLLIPVLLASVRGVSGLPDFFKRLRLIEVVRNYRARAANYIGEFGSAKELMAAIADTPEDFFSDEALPDPALYETIAHLLHGEFLMDVKPLPPHKLTGHTVAIPKAAFFDAVDAGGLPEVKRRFVYGDKNPPN